MLGVEVYVVDVLDLFIIQENEDKVHINDHRVIRIT